MAEMSGKLADPQFRTARASRAARASHAPAAHVRAIIAAAGDLTDEEWAALRALMPPPPHRWPEHPGGSGPDRER